MKKAQEKTTMSKKKVKKRDNMVDAAFKLFSTKGIKNTAIDDIVKGAGVAKGTFYLYFKDKHDIVDKLILTKSSEVLKEAMEATMSYKHNDFIDGMIFLIDYLIEYFKGNKTLLKIIYKNLSWGIYRKALARPDDYQEMEDISRLLLDNLEMSGYNESDIEKMLFMVIELTGSVLYSSIILEEPDNIDNMKPILFETIKKMLTH